jgi:FkbM family methyltransferase
MSLGTSMNAKQSPPACRPVNIMAQAVICESTSNPAPASPYTAEYISELVEHSYGDEWEQEELDLFRTLIADCDRFIDVGANAGQYTYAASQAMKGGEIVSIEANPFLKPVLDALATQIENISVRASTVTVTNAAAVDRAGPVQMFVSAYSQGSSVVTKSGEGTNVTVSGRPLDSFYRPSRKTLIKMDIEGAEYRAMLGADRFLASDHTVFFIELHGWGDAEIRKYPLDVCTLFRSKGYGVRHVGHRVRNHYLFRKEGPVRRWVSYVSVLPRLGFMALIYRYAKSTVPLFRFVRDRVLFRA